MATGTVSLESMTPEAKRGLLAALIRDLSMGRDSWFVQEDGREYHILTRPENARARAEQFIAAMTPADIAEQRRRIADLDNSFTVEELLQWNREEAAQGR